MDNNLLIEQNSGFKKKDSTVNQLLKNVIEYIHILIEAKIIASYSWVYQWHSIGCGTRAFYSNYVSLELLALSTIG